MFYLYPIKFSDDKVKVGLASCNVSPLFFLCWLGIFISDHAEGLFLGWHNKIMGDDVFGVN